MAVRSRFFLRGTQGYIFCRFSIIYFRGLGLRIRVRVWVRVRVRVSVVLLMVRVSVGLVSEFRVRVGFELGL